MGKYVINKDVCIQCGVCASVCPQECIDIDEKEINQDECIKCGTCMDNCPLGAIEEK